MGRYTVTGILDANIRRFTRNMNNAANVVERLDNKANDLSRTIKKLDEAKADPKVDVETRKAQLEILKVRKEMMELNKVKAKLDIELKSEKADAQLKVLQSRLNRDKQLEIVAQVRAQKANRELDILHAKLRRLDGQTVRTNVRLNQMGEQFSKVGHAIKPPSVNISGLLIPALGLLAAAAVPLVPVVAGGLLAVAGALTVAGAGAAAFGAFAIPAIQGVVEKYKELDKLEKIITDTASSQEKVNDALKKQKAILDKLSPAQRQAVGELQEFLATYRSLAKTLEVPALGIFSSGLKLVTSVMQMAQPVAMKTAFALQVLLDAANKGIKGESWTKFFKFLERTAQPVIGSLGLALGNFLTGFINLLRMSEPLIMDFVGGLRRMSASFLEWTKNIEKSGAFARFVERVRRDGPKVWEIIKQISRMFFFLGQALASINPATMEQVAAFFQRIADFAKANPEAIQKIVIALAAMSALKMSGIIGSLASLIPLLGAIGTTGGLVVGVVAGMVLQFGLLAAAWGIVYANSEDLRTSLSGLWDKLKEVFGPIVKENIQWIKDVGVPAIKDFAKAVGDNVAPAIDDLGRAIEENQPQIEKFFNFMRGTATVLINLWSIIGPVVGQAFATIIAGITNAIFWFGLFIDNIEFLVLSFKKIPQAWNAAWAATMAIGAAIVSAIVGDIRARIEIIKGIIANGGSWIKSAWNAAWAATFAVGRAILGAIVGDVRARIALIGAVVSGLRGRVVSAVQAAWSAARSVTIGQWNSIYSAVASAINRVIGLARTVVGRIRGALSGNLYGAGFALLNSFANGVAAAARRAVSAAASAVAKIRNLLPFSPAKEGPLSGKGYPLFSGRALVESLAQGIRQRAGSPARALSDVLGRMSTAHTVGTSYADSAGGPQAILAGGGGWDGEITVKLEIVGGDSELKRLITKVARVQSGGKVEKTYGKRTK